MKKNTLKKELDWVSMLVPLAIVLTVCALFMIFPEGSKLVLSVVRGFLGDDFGLYYALLGVGIVGCTLYIAFSKFGKIKLGDCEKPQYRSFQWGTMIFTSTMAADILFYSLCEWALYANESQVDGRHAEMGVHLPAFSLGTYRVGLLYCACGCIRLYDPYPRP